MENPHIRGHGRVFPVAKLAETKVEQDQAKSGFTGLLLSIGAMVSTTTSDVILKALETVPTKKVLLWCKETLGQSVQANRQLVFASPKKSEQKWNQSWTAV
ncbi:MAG: hypothetical protein GY832_22610 [Chloroflexi bacterium]|nr:hypothetical protein [Chloroflexota bacterium]